MIHWLSDSGVLDRFDLVDPEPDSPRFDKPDLDSESDTPERLEDEPDASEPWGLAALSDLFREEAGASFIRVF